MNQANIELFGIPDSIHTDAQNRLTAHFGSLAVALPDLSSVPTPLSPMKVEAVLRNGAWTAVRAAFFGKDQPNSAPLARTEPTPPRPTEKITQLQPRQTPTSGSAGGVGNSFSGLNRSRPSVSAAQHHSAPAPVARPAPALAAAPAVSARPRFDVHKNDDLDQDIPF